MAKLNLTTEADESTGVTILHLEGFLDADTTMKAEKFIQKLAEEGKYALLVDLEKLKYISSAGVGIFIANIREIRDKKGNIIFLNPTPAVLNVFELLGLTKLFKVVNDKKKALDELTRTG